MTAQPESAFVLEPELVRRFITGGLDANGQAKLAKQVSRLMPFGAELPNPIVGSLNELIEHLGGEGALVEWLDSFPGRPRKVARLFVFTELLDRFSGEHAVVEALRELREQVPYPPGLRRYLTPDTDSSTLASLSSQIEALVADDQVDEAVQLALDTATMLKQIAPRAAELDLNVSDLETLVDHSRKDLLEVAEHCRTFQDRRGAGRVLSKILEKYRDRDDLVVLGLPRGGVPVAYEVAIALGAPLDLVHVRKLGLPQRPDIAMGGLASDGAVVINDDVVRGFDVPPEAIEEAVDREGRELTRRELLYRPDTAPAKLTDRTVIIVDDGMATGACLDAAVHSVRKRRPKQIVVAVPAAPQSTCEELALEVDDVVSASTPSPFFTVGSAYWDFTVPTEDLVHELLRAANARYQPTTASY